MRNRHFFPCLLLLAFVLGGCINQVDSEITILERRIAKLEQRCSEINTTLQGLQKILDNLNQYDFITDVEAFYENGKVAGYTISFTNSDPIVLHNGTDAETPQLGVGLGDDGLWYWTVKYPSDPFPTFITDNFGVRIRTDAGTPLIKIENGNWMVSYDNGDVWHNLGRATGEDGASFFESVTDKGDYIEFKMLNGTIIQAPTWASFEKLQENCRKVNENLQNFMKMANAFNEKVYVQEMIPILQGTDTLGFRLQLSDGSSYAFYNGSGTNVPVIGAQRATSNPDDDVWYWTIRYGDGDPQWILDDKGNKIQANAPGGLTPTISLQQVAGDPAWYWAVAYGDGAPSFILCDGQKVKASVVAPEALVKSVVTVGEDKVCVTLSDGLVFYIPLPRAILVTLTAPVSSSNTVTMAAGDTVHFSCIISGSDERTEVLPVADEGFYSAATCTSADHRNWDVMIVAPKPFSAPSKGRVNVLVSNGYGQMKSILITILPKN